MVLWLAASAGTSLNALFGFGLRFVAVYVLLICTVDLTLGLNRLVGCINRKLGRGVANFLIFLLFTSNCSATPITLDDSATSKEAESRFLHALASNFTTPSTEFCKQRHSVGGTRRRHEPPVAVSQKPQRDVDSTPQADECATEASVPRNFEQAFGQAIRRSLSPWAGCPALTLSDLRRHFEVGAPWCRLQVCLVRGELLVRAFGRGKDDKDGKDGSGGGGGKLSVEYLGAERQHAALLGLAELLEVAPQLRELAVCVAFNCQDRPSAHGRTDPPPPSATRNGTKHLPSKLAESIASASAAATALGAAPQAWCQWRPEPPPLLLSYMTSLDHWDVPWPDYLFWGLDAPLDAPQKKRAVADWATVRASVLRAADAQLPHASRARELLYCSKLMHTDEARNPDRGLRGFYHAYMPLREAFTSRCLETCGALLTRPPAPHEPSGAPSAAAAADAARADADADADADAGFDLEFQPDGAFSALRQHHSELWRRTWAHGLQFTYKCQYRSLLLLQGRSAWLDHLKMELACGALVLFATDRARPTGDRMDGHPEPAASFFSHLLTPGEHYVHIDADHASPTMLAAERGRGDDAADVGGGAGGAMGGAALSSALPAIAPAHHRHVVRGGKSKRRLPDAVAAPRLPSHMAPLPADAIARGSSDLCAAVDTVRRWARAHPAQAACIGAKGKEVVRRWLTMEAVQQYMTRTLVAIAALQHGRALEAALAESPWYVKPRLAPCVRRAAELREARARGASTEAMERDGALACVARAVAAAVAAANATAFFEARAPLKERDRWLVVKGPRG